MPQCLYAIVSLLFYVLEIYKTFVIIAQIKSFNHCMICGCYLFSQDQLPLGWWTASDWLPRAQRCPPQSDS